MSAASVIDRFRLYLHVNKSQIWTIIKVCVALFLGGLVLSRTTTSELISTLQQIDIFWIGIGFLVFIGIIVTSGRRYWVLLGRKISFQRLLSVVIIQTVISSFVASGAGAVSYIAVLRGEHDVPTSRGLISLLTSRLGDVISIWFALVLSTWVLWDSIPDLQLLALALGVSILLGLLFFGTLIVFRSQIFKYSLNFNENSRQIKNRFVGVFLREIKDLAKLDSEILRNRLSSALYYSLWLILFNVLWGYCNIRAFQIPIGLWPLVFMVSITKLIAIIPVDAFGGLGINEVTFMYLYGIFGISQPEVAPFLVSARLLSYLFFLPILLYIPIENWTRIRKTNRA